jgi:hypothetical protein
MTSCPAAPILESLLDPIPRDRPPYPLMSSLDDGWEDTEIWEDPHPTPSWIRRLNPTPALTSRHFELVPMAAGWCTTGGG